MLKTAKNFLLYIIIYKILFFQVPVSLAVSPVSVIWQHRFSEVLYMLWEK